MILTNYELPVMASWMQLNGRRLDCNPYLSGAFEAKVRLEKLRAKKQPLQAVTKGRLNGIYHAGREGRTYVDDPKYGVPFLRSTSILAADLSSLPLLSKNQVAANPSFTIEEGWTLITRSGTVGRMAYVRPDMAGMACSEDVMRVVADTNKIKSGYLYAYLSGRFGLPIVVSGTYGAIIQHIEPQHIANLPVPIAPDRIQDSVHSLIQEAARLRTKGGQDYREATRLIFETLNLPDPQRHVWLADERRLGFSVEALPRTTLRASNYDPRYLKLLESLQKHKWNALGELCNPKHFKSGIVFKRIDAEPRFSVRLVGQRDAFQVRPEGRWISKTSIDGLGLVVPKGTTVIAAHGTLGETELYCRSTYVTERTSEYAFSGDFVRCVPLTEKVLPGYLFAFLRSETAFRILRSISTGSKQQVPHPELLWNIPIPRLEKDKEAEIHNIVELGAAKFDESLRLEEEGWKIIEDWIMEGG